VLEQLSGAKTEVEDPYLTEARNWGYQSLQQHQKLVVDSVASLVGLSSTDETSTMEPHDLLALKTIRMVLDTVKDPSRRRMILKELA
jgi:hypothetical protein